MKPKLANTRELTCPSCGNSEFELRVLSDEGVASSCCLTCSQNFLLLDSEDYWFDVIQATYPRLRKCSCKSTAFKLRCDYLYRDDGNIKSVNLWSTCSSCEKTKRQINIDIDYDNTENLFNNPLRFCSNPKLKYDLKELTLYITKPDMASIVDYLYKEHGYMFTVSQREGGSWVQRTIDAKEAQHVIVSGKYLFIYASHAPLELVDNEVATSRKEELFWKRHETIRISSPMSICMGKEEALLYYIQYSNEWVKDEMVIQKQPTFVEVTKSLYEWLNKNFVSWRSSLCFDNPTEHLRLFGDRFAKGRKSDGNR